MCISTASRTNDTTMNNIKKEIILCDLDGTIAILNGRDPYDASTCEQDPLNVHVYKVLSALKKDYDIIFLSGRMDKFRQQSENWLTKHGLMAGSKLLMRKTDDQRPDYVVKEEIYDNEIKDNHVVVLVLDDRLNVCRMWHRRGLPLLRVGDPDASF